MSDSQPVRTKASHPQTSPFAVYLLFNSAHHLKVNGEGTSVSPWSISIVELSMDHPQPPLKNVTTPKCVVSSELDGKAIDIYLSKSIEPAPFKGTWKTLRSLLGAEKATVDPILIKILHLLEPHLIEIPYLDFGPNEFIYRFRTEKQRNRRIYQSDETSQSLYQSDLCEVIKSARRIRENKSGEPAELDFGPVTYILPSHFGFCLGVQNAIERAYEVLSENPDRRVFMLSELIHNPFVNSDLQRRGLQYLQSDKGKPLLDPQTQIPYWESLNEEDIVIIPAFGATNEDKVRLIKRGLSINQFDATCMLVEKVWKAARRFAQDGYTVVIHGKAEHEETKATFSNTARYGHALVIRNLEEARHLATIIAETDPQQRAQLLHLYFGGKTTPHFDANEHLDRIAIVNQTTLLRNETLRIIEMLEEVMKASFGEEASKHLHPQSRGDTLCYATQVNQDALKNALESPLDAALVAGGKNSSNTYQLYRMCAEKLGEKAAYIQGEANILSESTIRHFHFALNPNDPNANTFQERHLPDFKAKKLRILITGGASCPDGIIQQIITRINQFYPVDQLRTPATVLAHLND